MGFLRGVTGKRSFIKNSSTYGGCADSGKPGLQALLSARESHKAHHLKKGKLWLNPKSHLTYGMLKIGLPVHSPFNVLKGGINWNQPLNQKLAVCSFCNQNVYLAHMEEDFRRYREQGMCVAVQIIPQTKESAVTEFFMVGNAEEAPYVFDLKSENSGKSKPFRSRENPSIGRFF
jgi:hypothetical protein